MIVDNKNSRTVIEASYYMSVTLMMIIIPVIFICIRPITMVIIPPAIIVPVIIFPIMVPMLISIVIMPVIFSFRYMLF